MFFLLSKKHIRTHPMCEPVNSVLELMKKNCLDFGCCCYNLKKFEQLSKCKSWKQKKQLRFLTDLVIRSHTGESYGVLRFTDSIETVVLSSTKEKVK